MFGIRRGISKVLGLLPSWMERELRDPAVHRALLLGGAAYMIRRAVFLDQPTAEGLSDKALMGVGVLLSKLPGSDEMKRTDSHLKEVKDVPDESHS